ncbi:MAG: Trk family potassium uptake protein [Clostridia bacterium]|nr:Trk family potassium uptake protein [Clostridia bacterium]
MKEKANKKHAFKKKMGWAQLIALGFALLILVGTIILCLPISSSSGRFTSPIDAAFTAVSASCVTGLITLDTATHWNTFGQIVILVMIQIGGIGFMTTAVLLSLIFKKAMTPKDRMLVANSYNLNSYDSISELVKRIIVGTLSIEGAGAALLAIRFIPDFGVAEGIYKSIFHSVSAFCNAGFDIIGTEPDITSLSHYATDPIVNITLALLIILGGIGFLVWSDIINFASKKRKLSVYSRFVIIVTLLLLVSSTLLTAIMEWNNPATIGEFSPPQKILSSFFLATSWRTAGFSMVENGLLNESTQYLGMLLMFIGGASGSTAGGVKVATFGIVIFAVWCVAVGKKKTVMFGRTVSDNAFVRATAVIVVQIIAALLGVILLNVFNDFSMTDILYEVISAVSTVGLTLGITPALSALSKLVIMLLMYFGRVGILTVTYAVMKSQSSKEEHISYPDANMLIG